MPEIIIGDQHIYYKITGEGSHTVLLLPGILGTIDLDFGDVIPLLNKTDFRWVCWDPPGYGKSRPQDRQVDDEMCERCANYAAQLMENLGFKSYSVAGYSQGSLFGILLTSSYPDRIKKLVVWGAFFSDSESFDMVYRGISNLDRWPKAKLDKEKGCQEFQGPVAVYKLPDLDTAWQTRSICGIMAASDHSTIHKRCETPLFS
ncbi:unnamed protein product [Allacma fusca]|uniref:AB hydrolase-1 domain-containing protein n=1 Tax=Allacma fusca TaxID=39272 RepID=A0A8J2KAH6_9HEXA|nr:unnamed protein product [Allacma fusca]